MKPVLVIWNDTAGHEMNAWRRLEDLTNQAGIIYTLGWGVMLSEGILVVGSVADFKNDEPSFQSDLFIPVGAVVEIYWLPDRKLNKLPPSELDLGPGQNDE